MKWNIALVLFFVLLLTIRYLIINDSLGSNVAQQKIRIMPLMIKKGKLENDFHTTELLTLDNKEKNELSEESEKRINPIYTKSVKEIGDEDAHLQVSMYSSQPFVSEKNKFLPSDKIYVSLVFPLLKAGNYNIITHWKTPWGTIARKIVRNIDLEEDVQLYKVFFWFQLVENGVFTKMFTGAEYKKKVFGEWEVLFYLDEEQIVSKHFIVTDI